MNKERVSVYCISRDRKLFKASACYEDVHNAFQTVIPTDRALRMKFEDPDSLQRLARTPQNRVLFQDILIETVSAKKYNQSV